MIGRAAMTLLLAPTMLAACDRGEPAVNAQAAAPANAAAPAAAPQGDVSTAERAVRERLGNARAITFANPRRGASEGVRIVCGEYLQGDARHRYIVVAGEDVFIEPQMQPGEMDRAFAEFCGDGARG